MSLTEPTKDEYEYTLDLLRKQLKAAQVKLSRAEKEVELLRSERRQLEGRLDVADHFRSTLREYLDGTLEAPGCC